jgi:starch synthase (maltosyl-transferring)
MNDTRTGLGRIPVTDVSPVVEGGSYPAKAVVDERIPIRATIFREGHDAVKGSVVLTAPDGSRVRVDMHPVEPSGLDPWETWVRLPAEGLWHFRVEGWSDPWHTWVHTATAKLEAGVDVELVCLEGVALLERTIAATPGRKTADILRGYIRRLDPARPPAELVALTREAELVWLMEKHGPRDLVSPTPDYPVQVDRRRALYASWYEFFPRSVGATRDAGTGEWASGSFDSCHARLAEIADMGFDVVYLPPVHPIGTSYRKGRNNTLHAGPNDPGSPWAIGAPDGGHDAIHPDLGDLAAFDRFLARAKELGMEVALDLALQCSPDHPWVREHPQWFSTRADGSIAYAENPPKKYQDIYPLNFDNDPEGLFAEVVRVVELWIGHGVRIFRVDNPHTKPLTFWARLLRLMRERHPDVIFFAEAFTRPAMMHALGKVGFHQSYTYFTWRTEQWEIADYLRELSRETDSFFRPNFFVNTPDINPFYLHSGNPAAFAIRAVLAATGSPAWGVYSGFELCEHEPLAEDREEYLDSEKYEYRPRDFARQPNLNLLLGTLNRVRREHPALQQLRQVIVHPTTNERIIAYTKWDGDDIVIVVCSLNPESTEEGEVGLDLSALGVPRQNPFSVVDQLTGGGFLWGEHNFVRLTPANPAHILHLNNHGVTFPSE